jgi:hypothetical protein
MLFNHALDKLFSSSPQEMLARLMAPARPSVPVGDAGRRERTASQVGRGPGWTQAHVKRMARKRRNVLRHRKACRGKR